MEKVLRIYGKEVAYDNGKKKFIAYSIALSKFDYCKVKFAQKVNNYPNVKGYVLIKFDINDAFIKKSNFTTKDGSIQTEYILWINKLIDWKEDKLYTEERRKQRKEELESILNENEPLYF